MSEPDCGCAIFQDEWGINRVACLYPAALARAESLQEELAALKTVSDDEYTELEMRLSVVTAERDELQKRVAELEEICEGFHCSQCGQVFKASACGPTHALIASKLSTP